MNNPEDRLRALRIEIGEDVREAHLADVGRALTRYRRRTLPRRRIVLAVAALLVVLQTAVVMAAEQALPGDPLHAVKVAFEIPRSWFDPDVRLRHRVEEAERMAESAPERVRDAIDEADRVIAEAPDPDPLLTRRLDAVREVEADRIRTPVDAPASGDDPDTPPPTSEGSIRDVTTTSSLVGDQRPADTSTTSSSSTTTTEAPRQRDATTTTAPPSDR